MADNTEKNEIMNEVQEEIKKVKRERRLANAKKTLYDFLFGVAIGTAAAATSAAWTGVMLKKYGVEPGTVKELIELIRNLPEPVVPFEK